jgi:hypothetical protein
MVYVYEWCKRRKYFGRTGHEVSHLLLDKGVLSVPESAHDDFVHEYSKGVLRGGRPSCVVEYKPRSFRMFYDLDIVVKDASMAAMMSVGDFPEDVRNIMHTICIATVFLFDVAKSSVIICISNTPKKKDGGLKLGIHITFESIFVTSNTALHVREKVLELLALEKNPFENSWDAIMDSAVFKGSGMRLVWAAKQDDLRRVYVPRLEYVLDRSEAGVLETVLDPEAIVTSLGAIKDVVARTCLRARGSLTKLRNPDIDISVSPSVPGNFSHASLREYSGVVEEINKAIPAKYNGRVTGVVKSEHVYMFRNSSKYCENVGREHTSSNTYFLVSRSGMRQCCYSRKDDDAKTCRCADFRGEYIKLPKKVMDELFPEEPCSAPPPPPPMPGMLLEIDTILATRTRRKTVVKKKSITRVYRRGSAIQKTFEVCQRERVR